jgi:hypothetical protein
MPPEPQNKVQMEMMQLGMASNAGEAAGMLCSVSRNRTVSTSPHHARSHLRFRGADVNNQAALPSVGRVGIHLRFNRLFTCALQP